MSNDKPTRGLSVFISIDVVLVKFRNLFQCNPRSAIVRNVIRTRSPRHRHHVTYHQRLLPIRGQMRRRVLRATILYALQQPYAHWLPSLWMSVRHEIICAKGGPENDEACTGFEFAS